MPTKVVSPNFVSDSLAAAGGFPVSYPPSPNPNQSLSSYPACPPVSVILYCIVQVPQPPIGRQPPPNFQAVMWSKFGFAVAQFQKGNYQLATAVPTPAVGQAVMYKTLTAQNTWVSQMNPINSSSSDNNDPYTATTGVTTSEEESSTFGVDIGVTVSVGYDSTYAALNVDFSYSRSVSYSISLSTQSTQSVGVDVPACSQAQLWQLYQGFSVTGWSLVCNPSDPMAANAQSAWMTAGYGGVPGSSILSQTTCYYTAAGPLQNGIYPTVVTLSPGADQQFVAGFATGVDVTWSLVPAKGSGTITSGGYYTAPDTSSGNSSITVQATPSSGNPASASVTLT